jgi:ubiquinone/menaquinone biosynthesis C-methylase UbiE
MNKNKWTHIFENKKIYIRDINLNNLRKFNFKKISYNLTNQVYSKFTFNEFVRLMEFFFKKLRIRKKMSLLDFGSGNGGILYYLIKKFNLKDCYSVEISNNFLNFQKKYITNSKFIKINFTSFKNLKKIKPNSINLTMLNSVSQYFYSNAYCLKVLNELMRVTSNRLFIYDIKNKEHQNSYIKNLCNRRKITIKEFKTIYKKTPLRFYKKDFFIDYFTKKKLKFKIFNNPKFALDSKYGFCILVEK